MCVQCLHVFSMHETQLNAAVPRVAMSPVTASHLFSAAKLFSRKAAKRASFGRNHETQPSEEVLDERRGRIRGMRVCKSF